MSYHPARRLRRLRPIAYHDWHLCTHCSGSQPEDQVMGIARVTIGTDGVMTAVPVDPADVPEGMMP